MFSLSTRDRRAFLAVILFFVLSLAGFVRQTALLVELQVPRIQSIGSMLFDQIMQTRAMDSRSPLAALVNEVWLSGQEIGWIRIEIDDGKTPISRGPSSAFENLPKTWRDACHRSTRFETRTEFGRSTMMAGAPTTDDEPGFCVFIGYNSDVTADALQWVIRKVTWVLLIVAVIVFVSWRMASEKIGIPVVVASVLGMTLASHFVVRGFVDHQTRIEAEKTAQLAAVDFKIALEGAPIHILENPSLIRDSLRDFLRRDQVTLGLGVEISTRSKHWEWRAGEHSEDRIMYGRVPLLGSTGERTEGAVIAAFPSSLSNVALFHSLMLVALLVVATWACSVFLSDATTNDRLAKQNDAVLPLVGAGFFFILVEELLRPALLLELQQQVSGIPQGASLWFGLNVFWICALWGTWTSYAWFQHFSNARILMVCAFVMALCLIGQGSIHDAMFWMPLRGIEGYAFGLGLQAGVVYVARLKEREQRIAAAAKLAQGALVATVVGPIVGGAWTRVAGTTSTFFLAAGAAATAAWLTFRVTPDTPDKNAQSALSLLFAHCSRRLAIPLLATGIANRTVWFSAVGLLLPTIANSQPLGAAAVGELIGLLGLGMFIGRRYIDHRSIAISLRMGWITNVTGAMMIGIGYTANISIWLWMLFAFITGVALSVGSRAQQDWILAQPMTYASGLHGTSRLADRGGALLAGLVIPLLYNLPNAVISLTLIAIVILLWLFVFLYSAPRLSR